jgi:hypothetical protein
MAKERITDVVMDDAGSTSAKKSTLYSLLPTAYEAHTSPINTRT